MRTAMAWRTTSGVLPMSVITAGEKAGDLERTGRRFEMRNSDAMGYNAASTDPLYKHIPFTITRGPEASFGLFYDNPSSCWLDLGNEIDNYHAAYRRYQAEAGDLDYYLFLGPKVLDVTKAFVRLTGRTHFGPKWSPATAVRPCTTPTRRTPSSSCSSSSRCAVNTPFPATPSSCRRATPRSTTSATCSTGITTRCRSPSN